MAFLALGINHKTASVDVRERVAFTPEQLVEALQQLCRLTDSREAAILSTCNRSELYAVVDDAAEGLESMRQFLLVSQMISSIVLVLGLFRLIAAWGLIESTTAVGVVYMAFNVAFTVWMLQSYFDTIPDEIEEAAMMDGLNRLQIIFRITVPLAISGLVSVFVYCFMVAWNDYLFASIFLSSASNFTLPVGLNTLFSTPDYIWGRMMAASLVTALPVVIMYALSERFIKSGLTAGGVKG